MVNLEQLRTQAKELARTARAGEPTALARLGDLPPRLASAQLVLAREHGYSSWPALVHEFVEQRNAALPAAGVGIRRVVSAALCRVSA